MYQSILFLSPLLSTALQYPTSITILQCFSPYNEGSVANLIGRNQLYIIHAKFQFYFIYIIFNTFTMHRPDVGHASPTLNAPGPFRDHSRH